MTLLEVKMLEEALDILVSDLTLEGKKSAICFLGFSEIMADEILDRKYG